MHIFKKVGYTARTQAVGLGQVRQNCHNWSSIIFYNDVDLLYCTILIVGKYLVVCFTRPLTECLLSSHYDSGSVRNNWWILLQFQFLRRWTVRGSQTSSRLQSHFTFRPSSTSTARPSSTTPSFTRTMSTLKVQWQIPRIVLHGK